MISSGKPLFHLIHMEDMEKEAVLIRLRNFVIIAKIGRVQYEGRRRKRRKTSCN